MHNLKINKDGKAIAEICGNVTILNNTATISTLKEDKVNALKLVTLIEGAKYYGTWLEIPIGSISCLTNSVNCTKYSLKLLQPEDKEK